VDDTYGGLVIVAAIDRTYAIGRSTEMLPWHLPDDLKRFKSITIGRSIVMGRRTAKSIGRALPGRRNYVLSRSGTAPWPGQVTVRSLDEAIALAGDDGLTVGGGGEVYALALPYASAMRLTCVDAAVPDADTWFPRFDADEWTEIARERHDADERHPYPFEWVDYVRS
jgi:dihydrofolate reductase